MTRLTATNRPPSGDESEAGDRDMALVLSGDACVCTIIHAPTNVESGESIDALWPEQVCDRIRRNLRLALRSRKFFVEELDLDDVGQTAEFTYITQGRDRVLLVIRNTSQRQQDLSRLQQLAYLDYATTLPNREFFLSELEKIVEHQRLREGRTAVICCHIDHPDTQHRAIGTARHDEILRELGARLVHELRGANSSDDEDYERRSIVARTDFKRFGVVLPEIESGIDAESVTERLTLRLQEPLVIDGKSYDVRVHAGIGLFPQDGSDAQTLFDNANAATEDARAGKAGEVAFHSGTVKLRTLQRQDLEVELRTALERGAFALNFLPIIDAATGRVHAVEALLRWPDSVMGSHSTTKVVGLAERTGLIVPIGEWVLRESFDQLKAWEESGHPDIRLSVNLSMQEFSRPDMAARMAGLMLQPGVQPTSIDIEITEKMVCRDAVTGYQAMDELKALGVGLVVDDFGTGACSLAHLAHSPIDGIKIDISLVSGAEACAKDLAACCAAISSAHALGLKAVAEGVETDSQSELLAKNGCDFLQGFHFTRPLPAAELSEFLAKNNSGEEM